MMFGDFSRSLFRKTHHHSGVFLQQGRPLIDADWNEQVSIYMHYFRTLAADIIGDHGGPIQECGFEIMTDAEAGSGKQGGKSKSTSSLNPRAVDFRIGKGRYYVNGVCCENDHHVLFSEQSDWPVDKKQLPNLESSAVLIYLDVWERHIGDIEYPGLRDVALPIESACRLRVVWQVKACDVSQFGKALENLQPAWNDLINEWQPPQRGRLKAKAKGPEEEDTGTCAISPASQYRGLENQLYRVQVHVGGSAGHATFKYSRDNGAVVFAIKDIQDRVFWLKGWGKDDGLSLAVGDCVEYVDDDVVLQNRADPLFQVVETDSTDAWVKLESKSKSPSYPSFKETKHPLLRRWDHKVGNKAGQLKLSDGVVPIIEGQDHEGWIPLEYGIEIQFEHAEGETVYRTGDYWLIPARVTTGDVEWPRDHKGNAQGIVPLGVEHHYAPLGVIFADEGQVRCFDWRNKFEPLIKNAKR
jgi:hypothetical protein